MSWGDLENEASDVQSDEFAEAVVVVPMVRPPNERATADPARASYATRGIFEWPSDTAELLKGRDKSATPPAAFHASRKPTISFDKRDLQSALIEGDRIVLTERGDLVFEIMSPDPDGHGRIKCRLNQQGAHSQ